MQSFKMIFSGVTILQGVEFPIFPIDFAWALQQCSATALPVINIVSNLIFHCNNCDENTAFATIRESTAAAPSSGLLNAKFTFKGTSPPIIFARLVRPMNAYTTMSLIVFTQRNFSAEFIQSKCDSKPETAVLRF